MRLIDADRLREFFETESGDQSYKFIDLSTAFKFALRTIDKAPTIDPDVLRPQWIPVAERLPEKYEDVLITYRIPNEKAARIWFGYRVETGWCAYGVDRPNPTAWMPLPEPYEPEDVKQEV